MNMIVSEQPNLNQGKRVMQKQQSIGYDTSPIAFRRLYVLGTRYYNTAHSHS